jgi:hypothetical protein
MVKRKGLVHWGKGVKASRAWSWTFTSISLTVRPARLKEMTLANRRNTIRDLPAALESSSIANCTQKCPWRTGIPQNVHGGHQRVWCASAQIDVSRVSFLILNAWQSRIRVRGTHSDRRRGMNAPCHSSKQNSLERVVREHANSRTSDNFKVCLLGKLGNPYSGMRKQPSSFQSVGPHVEWDTLRRMRAAIGRERPAHAMQCDPAARHCNPHRTRQFTGNAGPSTPLVLTFNRPYHHSFEPLKQQLT